MIQISPHVLAKQKQNKNNKQKQKYRQRQKQNEYRIKYIEGQDSIKNLVKLYQKQMDMINLQKSCMFNGILFRDKLTNNSNRQKNAQKSNKIKDSLINNTLSQIFKQPIKYGDIIICYLNPQLSYHNPISTNPSININTNLNLSSNITPTTIPSSSSSSSSYKKQQYKHSTYLQLKSLLQFPKLNMSKLFNADMILNDNNCQPTCIYVLLFCLKVVMFNNQNIQGIPVLFLEEFVRMQANFNIANINNNVNNGNSILSKVVDVMKFCYSISILSMNNNNNNTVNNNNNNKPNNTNNTDNNKQQTVNNCIRNILQISSVNSHILIDAILLQFGIQLNQQNIQIRHNPLLQLQISDKIKYKFHITNKINNKIIYHIKILWDCYQVQIIQILVNNMNSNSNNNNNCNNIKNSSINNIDRMQTINKINNIVIKWNQQVSNLQNIYQCTGKSSILLSTNSQSQEIYNQITYDKLIFKQYLLSMRIFVYLTQSQLLTDILRINNPPTNTNINSKQSQPLLPLSQKSKQSKRIWQQILQDFMNDQLFQYCTAELALTVLTIDILIKLSDNNIENIQQSLNKCIDIWFRINRDPRAMYKPYVSNYWIVYLIKIFVDFKVKNQGNPYATTIYQLHNIVQCLYSNRGVVQYGTPNQLAWILNNIPIGNFSGIFYKKNQLLISNMQQNSQSLFFKNANILIENPSSQLSSKSNYSQSMSNTSSSLSKTRKKQRSRGLENSVLSKNKAIRNGVYFWGKGIHCGPLIYPFAKNLEVLKIACGNYHAVIATTTGIFGWGENGSGQLGYAQSKQTIKTVKMILKQHIVSTDRVSISCGNQHTVILLKQQELIMFGQSEGGIISGHGHKFDSVSCGGLHTLGIKDGKVFSWGRGQGGQLGHKPENLKIKIKSQSTDFYLDSPKMIENLPFIKKSICGDAHSVLLSQSGEVFVFGFSYQGQLGIGLTGQSDVFQIFQPVELKIQNKNSSTSIKFADIFAGSTFTFLKTIQGQIYSCGLNDCNQLGMQRMMKVFHKKKYLGQQKKSNQKKMGQVQFSKPKKLQIFNNQIKVNQIYCGQNHCLASVEYLKKNKMVMGWGLNKQYQISSQFSPENLTPRTIDNIYEYNFSQLCCGSNFSVGLIKNQNRLTLQQLQQRIQFLIQNSIVLNFTK